MFFDVSFLLLLISLITMVVVFVLIVRIRNKKQIHYVFGSLLASGFLWTFGYGGMFLIYNLYGYNSLLFVNITITGIVLTPVFIFLLGYTFANTKAIPGFVNLLIFLIPVISLILVYTNNYHHLFYVFFSAENTTYRVFGGWNIIHIAYSYSLIIIGLWFLLYFSIKNSGFFSRQSQLILVGIVVPLIVNILITFNLGNLPYYYESVAFSFAFICFAVAIFKFQFLNVVPIALQTIVDLMSDGYIVINNNHEIIDFNKPFIDMFRYIGVIKRKMDFIKLLDNVNFVDSHTFTSYNEEAILNKKTITFEKQMQADNLYKHFTIEITPIFSKEAYIGTIFLMKDITEHIKNIETIKRNQTILLEQERLASLGQLVGGIAHNLKTPIMSISGGLEGLDDLIGEYESSIDDASVTKEDHTEIAEEMRTWIKKLKPYCAYMSDIITAVKGQTVQWNSADEIGFSIEELVKRVEILMKHELKLNHCELVINMRAKASLLLKGEINHLVQIVDNLIMNAIQAYDGKPGVIEFTVSEEQQAIQFSVRDYGNGIPQKIKNRLFKEMITTKGHQGTGLGLYISYSTIVGKFDGKMWFESTEGKGTEFFVAIPYKEVL